MIPDVDTPAPLPPQAPCPRCGGWRFWLPIIQTPAANTRHTALLRWHCEVCHLPERVDLVDAEYEVGGKVCGSCPCRG
jgi:hypothetical protein